MKTKEAMELFTLEAMQKIITQKKTIETPFLSKYFTTQIGHIGANVAIPIKRSENFILHAISKTASAILSEDSEEILMKFEVPRFAQEGTINATDLNELKSFENGGDLPKALSQKISDIITSHKENFCLTQEFMAVGAVFGRVVDGKGNVLFEVEIKNKAGFSEAKSLHDSFAEIYDSFSKNLGYHPEFDLYVSRELFEEIHKKAMKEELFKINQARLEKNAMQIYGVEIIPYVASYRSKTSKKDTQFLSGKTGMAIPKTKGIFQLHYSRAHHTQALNLSAQKFFAAKPEELAQGRGYCLHTESNVLPICVRPDALVKLEWI
ncbi:major capsid protein [uncultured Helicobacter sp.]|uniref:major capsid protein n=1 Tax=uncultured Helicobacter sp. TaxID=175537 RepID=UPI00262F2986|nr:major capsid protein [uncultured Helicobacter sp.]